MALLTAQQISRYFDQFQSIDVTFTKEVTQALGLLTKQTYLKYLGFQVPCIVYSSSMMGAKVIANVKNDAFAQIRESNNVVSLRFAVIQPDKSDPLSFFVTSRIVGYSPYGNNEELNFVSLSFTQRPPDDLIAMLGQLLEANVNAKRRREDRIVITADSLRRLGIVNKDAIVYIQGVPRKCIVRDLSFSGAKLIVTGIGKFLIDKEMVLHIELEDKRKELEIPGKIIRFDAVEGRRDIAALAVQFDEEATPLEYKIRINEYLTLVRQGPSED